jgi:hypothetical protein
MREIGAADREWRRRAAIENPRRQEYADGTASAEFQRS